MATDLLVGHYAEIALKGGNRRSFEQALLRQARATLPRGSRAELRGSRLLVWPAAPEAKGEAMAALGRCFGLVTIREATSLPQPATLADIAATAIQLARQGQARGLASFKIAARRADKTFALDSLALNHQVGAAVAQATGLAVDVHRPALEIGVDVREDAVYLWGHSVPGPGGLPTGTAGRALCLLSGGIDSPVAAWLAAKRGLRLSAVYCHAFPYTGDGTRDKVIDLCRRLAAYAGDVRLWVLPFTPIQLAVADGVPEPLRTLVARRMMLRGAGELARRERAGALVTGDSLGQVASQTLEALTAVGEVATLPLLRPLVTADKTEIIDIARRIGTYEVSIRPFDDCCTLFAPRHPRTRPTRVEVARAEGALDVEGLIAACVAGAQRLRVTAEAAVPDPPPGPAT